MIDGLPLADRLEKVRKVGGGIRYPQSMPGEHPSDRPGLRGMKIFGHIDAHDQGLTGDTFHPLVDGQLRITLHTQGQTLADS